MSHKNEDEIIQKVNEILNSSVETAQDKALQKFIKYIFTDEFKKETITPPIKKREKDPFKFLEQYIKLVYSLFKLKMDERNKLYKSAFLGKNYSEISQHIEQLNKLIEKKKDVLTKIMDNKKDQLNLIKSYLFNMISNQPNTLFSILDKYHFYFIFYVPSPSSLKFLLFSIFKNKFQDVLVKFDYQDFCPDFNDETCQNLIVLFFENIKNEKKEILFIFALLIFNYEVIFKYRIGQKISKYILQYAAKITYKVVEKKTLENALIFEYTYNEYLSNLDKTILLLEKKKRKISYSSINDKYESHNNNSQIVPLNNGNNNIQSPQKSNKNSTSPTSNDEHQKTEEVKIPMNNENKINILFSSLDKNKNNNSKEENTNDNEITEEIKSEIKIEGKDKVKDNNNKRDMEVFNNKMTQENLPEINNPNIISSKKEENSQSLMNLTKEEINNLNCQTLYSLFQTKLSELERKFFEKEKENEKKFSELESEINNLKGIIGTIQIRTYAKNFLRIFKSGLSSEEKAKIKNDKSKKGEATLDSLIRIYSAHINDENFKTVYEIVEKSGDALNKGNDFAHSLDLKDYEKEIMEFKEKFNIKLADVETLEKIIFLIKIGISDDTFINCFKFVSKYCGKAMTLKFLRRNDNIETFIEGKHI